MTSLYVLVRLDYKDGEGVTICDITTPDELRDELRRVMRALTYQPRDTTVRFVDEAAAQVWFDELRVAPENS